MTATPHYHLVPKGYHENLAWRADVLRQAATDRGMQRDIKKMCAEDLLFHLNLFGWVIEPRPKMSESRNLPFITYDYQDEALCELNDCIGQCDVAIKKSRDMGASWMILFLLHWRWLFMEYESFLLVSRNEDYVDKPGNPKALFFKLDYINKHLPPWMLPKGFTERLHRRGGHLENPENGAVLDGEATTGDLAAGDRRTAIMLDEFARFDVLDSYRAMSSTISATDCRIFNSTFKGSGNAFADVVEKGHTKVIWLPWHKHPIKRVGLYVSDGTKHAPDHKGKLRSPWYDKECERAVHPFEIQQEVDGDAINSNAQFFDTQTLQDRIETDTMPPFAIGELRFEPHSLEPEDYCTQDRGRLKLWIHPDPYGKMPQGLRCAAGADIAAGTGASNSVLMFYNRDTGEKIGEFVDPNIRPEEFGRYAVAMCKWFNDAFLVAEANGPGKTFLAVVIENDYSNIYFRRNEDVMGRPVTMNPGWWAGKEEKGHLFAEYRSALRDRKIINRSKDALQECREIVFTPDNSVEHVRERGKTDPSGAKYNHGDRPTADALAWMGCKEHVVRSLDMMKGAVEAPREIPVGSMAWRELQGVNATDEELTW